MREIVIATKNRGKLEEFRRMLEPLGFRVLSQEDVSVNGQAVEDGNTFEANAKKKAQYVFERCGKPVIADDSGLCVDALAGAPGVYSARYAGEYAGDEENNRLLLKNMEQVPQGKRDAQFVCVIAAILSPEDSFAVCGECPGEIAFEPHGSGGFGYDPLFFAQGRSFAEWSGEEKDRMSHRGIALRLLLEELKQRKERV